MNAQEYAREFGLCVCGDPGIAAEPHPNGDFKTCPACGGVVES